MRILQFIVDLFTLRLLSDVLTGKLPIGELPAFLKYVFSK